MEGRGRYLTLLAAVLAVCAVVYLLIGDELGAGSGTAGGGAGRPPSTEETLTATGLEPAGQRPPSPEEIARAQEAALAAARAFPRAEGFFGTVMDSDGRPIPRATVQVLPAPREDRHRQGTPDRPPLASAESDAAGAYLVGPAPEGAPVKLRAQAAGHAPTVQPVTQRGVRVDLVLDRGGALDVRVLDLAGEPVAEATVVHVAGPVVSTAVTDTAGLARFQGLPTGAGGLVVTKAGVGSVRDDDVAVAPGTREERTLILPPGVRVSGQVVDGEQRPVAGATVGLRYTSLPTLPDEGPVSTGPDGRFQLTVHASGQERIVLRAVKPGLAEGRLWTNAAAQGEQTIVLSPLAQALSGRVVGADRQPAGGVRVTYALMGIEDGAELPVASSQEDGTFGLPLPPWILPGWTVTVIADGGAQGLGVQPVRIPKDAGATAERLELALGGTGSVAGRVTDATGEPVQGALVSLAPDWSVSARNGVDRDLVRILMAEGTHELGGVSGADGSYAIPAVPALGYRVSASFGLDLVTLPDAVLVAPEEVVQADVTLGSGRTIEGWVRDAEERPVAGAWVSARLAERRRGGSSWAGASARSRSDGRFVLRGVGDGRHDVRVRASGYGGASARNVEGGTTDLVLRLTARGWLQGVIYREGEPFRGLVTVVARPAEDVRGQGLPLGGLEGEWSGGPRQRTLSTDDGRFEVRGLEAGAYLVSASTREGLVAVQPDPVGVVDGRGSRDVRLDLFAGATLRGTVRSDAAGGPVSGAWVYVNARAGEAGAASGATSGHGRTDAQGHYEVKGLGGGAYTVTVWMPTGSSFSTLVDLQGGEERTLDLAEQPPGTIQFTVVDEAGAPLAGARAHVRSVNGNYVSVNVQAMQRDGLVGESYDWRALWETDAQGTLARTHVPPGALVVWATRTGYAMAGEQPTVTVRSGAVTPVRLVLKRTGG